MEYQPLVHAPVGLAVRKLRLEQGLSLAKLAERAYGAREARQCIHALEAAARSRCQRSTVERLAPALGVTPQALVDLAHELRGTVN